MNRSIITALITPMQNTEIDLQAFDRLINFQLEAGVDGILILGTTGEASTITPAERRTLIIRAKSIIRNKASLMVGCSSNDTLSACQYAYEAEKYGADEILAVTPYYNKCSPQGAYNHYSLIAKSIDIPLVLYNVPSRTGFNLPFETINALSEIKNITAIKEASGNFSQFIDIIEKTPLCLYSGDDLLTLPILALGGAGVISVLSNIVPNLICRMTNSFLNNRISECQSLLSTIKKLNDLCFCEVNPIPVKYALHLMGYCENEYRLPLTQPSENSKIFIENTLDSLSLL